MARAVAYEWRHDLVSGADAGTLQHASIRAKKGSRGSCNDVRRRVASRRRVKRVESSRGIRGLRKTPPDWLVANGWPGRSGVAARAREPGSHHGNLRLNLAGPRRPQVGQEATQMR